MSTAYKGVPGPGGFDHSRAVQVVTTREAGRVRLGSGYLVTGDTVLTAAHVVRDAESVLVRFVAVDGRTTEFPVTPVWEDSGVDVAVLKIAEGVVRAVGPSTIEAPPMRFGRLTGPVDCEALGFPRFKIRRGGDTASPERGSGPYRDSHHALGRTTPWSSLRQGSLEITLPAAPNTATEPDHSPWEGMSGAALWSDGCIIGVVSEQHRPEGTGMLAASRVERWYRLADRDDPNRIRELNKLIGLPATPDQLEQLPRRPASPTAPTAPSDSAPELEEEADRLAASIRGQWRAEEKLRRLDHPFPLAVRFRNAVSASFDHWANILEAPPEGNPPSRDLTGRLQEIAQVYQRREDIPSGRLVVLGAAGAGKSVLALQFVLEMLRVPADGASPVANGKPVPVIFSLGSWNPVSTSLNTWMHGQLVRDHPWLRKPSAHGTSLAGALIGSGRILPVLDGFDEIAGDLRGAALQELNKTPGPLLLTSRPTEYAEAVAKKGVLDRVPGIELDPLAPKDFAAYLRRASPPGANGGGLDSTAWEPVLTRLDERPLSAGASHVAEGLSTPLMVSLARTVYSDAPQTTPERLLDVKKFPSPEAVQSHLLAAFVPAAYAYDPQSAKPASGPNSDDDISARRRRRHWDPERAEYWLGYIARHLDNLPRDADHEAHDLAWWELGTTLPRFTRALIVGFLAGLAFAVTTAIGNIPVDLVATSRGLRFALVRGLVVGLLHGLAAALLFGFLYHFASGRKEFKPSPVRMSIFREAMDDNSRAKARARARIRFMIGVGGGLAVALMLIFIDRVVVDSLGLSDGLDGGLLGALVFVPELALGAGLVYGLLALLETPITGDSAVSPADVLDTNRRNAMFRLLTWALVIGLEAGIVDGILNGPLRGFQVGAVFGLEAAFGAGLGYGLSLTAWGQWMALCRIWLPLRGKLPWALMAFLDDAHRRDVLRQAGAVYQFRHAEIQSHLSRTFQERHERLPETAESSDIRSRRQPTEIEGDS